jgi:type IV pilus assembly protein PilA
MIVVAIIGILAAVAIPQYQDYVIRSKLSKVSAAVDPIKLAIAEYAQFNGGYAGLTAATAYNTANTWTNPINSGGLGFQNVPTLTTEISDYSYTAGTDAAAPIVSVTLRGIGTGINGHQIDWTPGAAGSNVITWAITSADFTSSSTGNAKTVYNEIAKWK